MADRGSRIEAGSVGPRRGSPAAPSASGSILVLLSSVLLLSAPAARAQAPDSAQAAPAAAPPVGFAQDDAGAAVADTIPARLPEIDVPALLDALPGAFVYEFGTLGWPDAWSRDALPPHRTALTLDGLLFDDPATGRPRYDLLPTAWLEPPVVGAGRHGAPVAVATRLRPYAPRRPITEIAYRSGSGIQSVMATHVQRRTRRLFGQDGVLGLLGGYGGHAAQGEYDGSRLRRGRQLLGRLRYAQPRGAVELRVLHNRRSLGAHGGVLPVPGFSFESIYARLVAPVRDPGARRRTVRTDAALTVRTRLRPGADPLTASAFATKAFFEYRLPGRDTLAVASRRAGGRLAQNFAVGAHRLRLAAEAWRDWTVGGTTGLPDTLGLGRTRLQLLLRDAFRAGPLAVEAEARLHEGVRAGGHLGATLDAGPVRLFAEAERAAGAPPAWAEQHGFGPFLEGLPGAARERTLAGRAGLTLRAGAFDATAFGFAHRIDDAVDLYETGEDTAAVRVLPSALRRAGAAADLGWRRDARRGLYLIAQPTLTALLDAGASDLHARQDAALPTFFANGRLGARYLLFNGDLDLDVSVRGRFWTSMRSRTLHPATGLLALPALGARPVPASGTLDLVGLGRVRTATLFIAYENVLSGTSVLAGNYLVPVYPLPARRLRFGVFWPIPN